MNVNPINTFKAPPFNKTQTGLSANSEKKSNDKINTILTEKFEPSLNEKSNQKQPK